MWYSRLLFCTLCFTVVVATPNPFHGLSPADLQARVSASSLSTDLREYLFTVAEEYRTTTFSYSRDGYSYTMSSSQPPRHPERPSPLWTAFLQFNAHSITTRIGVLTLAWMLGDSPTASLAKATEMVSASSRVGGLSRRCGGLLSPL